MHALVYTGTQKIDYREEKDPTQKPGENIIKAVSYTHLTLPTTPYV